MGTVTQHAQQDATGEQKLLIFFCALFCVIWIEFGLIKYFQPNVTNNVFIGTDFASFFAASFLTLQGKVLSIYDQHAHWAAEKLLLGPDTPYYAFFYPPIYLLFCLPLALMPYYVALAAWLGASAAGCLAALRCFAPDCPPRLLVMALLASPAAYLNIAHGQNAFITTGLFAAGFALLDRRPWLAGACLGLLIIKPHFGLLLPPFLILSGRWRPALAAALTVICAGLFSAAAFGGAVWSAYLNIMPMSRTALESNIIGNKFMVTGFAMVRELGGSLATAYALQAVLALAVALTVIVAAVRLRDARAAGAVVSAGTLLISPFLLRYDLLLLLLLPLCWLAQDARLRPLRPAELSLCIAAYGVAYFSYEIADATGFLPVPLVLAAFFIMLTRRVWVASQH